ncbi:hypothetical protein TWF718_005851 [Orbilia javanica]|uniref:Uncharacterized protein n=1 Tax=Orbilia javanica TaxID=47235 RepID=A0AAN8N8C5_9PEZI
MMKSHLQTCKLGQWLTILAFLSLPLVHGQVVTIPFQTFKDGLKYSSDSTISPLRTGISNLNTLVKSVYPIELPSGSNSPTSVSKTVSTKLWGLEHGIDQVNDELADSSYSEENQADFDALGNVVERIREKFMAYSTTTIQVPNGFYTTPDPHESQSVDIWTFINSLASQLVLNGGPDSPEASAGRLVSFFFSASLPDSGTITLDFDAFDIRLRTLLRLVNSLTDLIDAPSEDIQNFITMINDFNLSNAFELEIYLTAGYEEVQDMLKAYLNAVSVISWGADELYWELKGLWLDE